MSYNVGLVMLFLLLFIKYLPVTKQDWAKNF